LTTFLLCASVNFTCPDPEACIKTCISAISSKDAGRPVTPVVCFYLKATQNAFPVQARTTGQAVDTLYLSTPQMRKLETGQTSHRIR